MVCILKQCFFFFFFLVFAVQRDHQRIVTSKWAKEEKKNVRNKFPITARVLKQGGGKYISLSPLLIILWVLYILCYSRPRGNTRSMCFRHSFALMHNESEVCDGAILKRDLRAISSIVLRRPAFWHMRVLIFLREWNVGLSPLGRVLLKRAASFFLQGRSSWCFAEEWQTRLSLTGGVSLRHTGAETGRKPKLAGSGQSLTRWQWNENTNNYKNDDDNYKGFPSFFSSSVNVLLCLTLSIHTCFIALWNLTFEFPFYISIPYLEALTPPIFFYFI